MIFREATNADRTEVETLVFTVLAEYGLQPDPTTTDADLADIEGSYFAAGGCFDLLINDDDHIAGTVAVHRTEPGLGELRKMYLAPCARGMGWGTRLLERGIDRARALGFRRLWLETAACLLEATRLYEKHGFTPYEAPHCSARCDFALSRDL